MVRKSKKSKFIDRKNRVEKASHKIKNQNRKKYINTTVNKMNQMKNLFNVSKKSTDASDKDALTLAVEEAKKEKEEMRKEYEARILNLEIKTMKTSIVLQAMVLVARKSPDDFFALLDEEGEDWNLIDLKYVASSINIELEDAIERKIRNTSNGEVSEMQPSTAQRLYSYVMMDPQADKKTAIEVIAELHKELVLLEEKESKENPTKKTIRKARCASNKSTITSLRREMNLLEEVLLENKKENEIDQERIVPEEVEVDKASGVIAVSGYKMEDDESTTPTISSESVDSIDDSIEFASDVFYSP